MAHRPCFALKSRPIGFTYWAAEHDQSGTQLEDKAMQISRTHELEGGRGYCSIARIKASSGWHAANADESEVDRLEAFWGLVSEAQEFHADAVIDLGFEVEAIGRPDYPGAPLRRIAATGIAVRFTLRRP
jgi:uncharacterized protein YbjQ (UPF0145 family)